MKIGDYVLATKYSDGDPLDQWCVGFYHGITDPHYNPVRFDVVDSGGKLFRRNGFRRCEVITREQGEWLLAHKEDFIGAGRSLWELITSIHQRDV